MNSPNFGEAYNLKGYDSYNDAVKDLKKWIRKRIIWIDEQYQKKNDGPYPLFFLDFATV